MMGCSHPTIWKFLDVLKKEQNLTDVKVAQHLSRQQPPKRAKKWTDYDDRLRRIVTDYDSYDLLDFLKAVGNAILDILYDVYALYRFTTLFIILMKIF